jgi:hypothetical protein
MAFPLYRDRYRWILVVHGESSKQWGASRLADGL